MYDSGGLQRHLQFRPTHQKSFSKGPIAKTQIRLDENLVARRSLSKVPTVKLSQMILTPS